MGTFIWGPRDERGSKRDQVITVPDAGVMFTGDLVETGQFAIFPWFPRYDADVSGLRWINAMGRLIDEHPQARGLMQKALASCTGSNAKRRGPCHDRTRTSGAVNPATTVTRV